MPAQWASLGSPGLTETALQKVRLEKAVLPFLIWQNWDSLGSQGLRGEVEDVVLSPMVDGTAALGSHDMDMERYSVNVARMTRLKEQPGEVGRVEADTGLWVFEGAYEFARLNDDTTAPSSE